MAWNPFAKPNLPPESVEGFSIYPTPDGVHAETEELDKSAWLGDSDGQRVNVAATPGVNPIASAPAPLFNVAPIEPPEKEVIAAATPPVAAAGPVTETPASFPTPVTEPKRINISIVTGDSEHPAPTASTEIPQISISSNGELSMEPASPAAPKTEKPIESVGIALPGLSSNDVHAAGGFAGLDPAAAANKNSSNHHL
jgi:hypothetical protein